MWSFFVLVSIDGQAQEIVVMKFAIFSTFNSTTVSTRMDTFVSDINNLIIPAIQYSESQGQLMIGLNLSIYSEISYIYQNHA